MRTLVSVIVPPDIKKKNIAHFNLMWRRCRVVLVRDTLTYVNFLTIVSNEVGCKDIFNFDYPFRV